MKLRKNPLALFLLAPAGAGKTTLIFDLYERNSWNILFILPLKSLERELSKKIEKMRSKKPFFEAVTVEKAISFLEKVSLKERENTLVVLDEVHLWNSWGEDFRPVLWECLYYIGHHQLNIFGLTATLKSEYEQNWKELFEFGAYEFKVLNFGNGQLVYQPEKEISYSGLEKSQLSRRLCFEIENKKNCLVFCKYRSEVEDLKLFLMNQFKKLSLLTCVGGGSQGFTEELSRLGLPQIIISTSTLSHGVNLGEIERVFITYEIAEWDMLLQMKARGGRSGKGFIVFNRQRGQSDYFSRLKLKLFDRYLTLFYA